MLKIRSNKLILLICILLFSHSCSMSGCIDAGDNGDTIKSREERIYPINPDVLQKTSGGIPVFSLIETKTEEDARMVWQGLHYNTNNPHDPEADDSDNADFMVYKSRQVSMLVKGGVNLSGFSVATEVPLDIEQLEYDGSKIYMPSLTIAPVPIKGGMTITSTILAKEKDTDWPVVNDVSLKNGIGVVMILMPTLSNFSKYGKSDEWQCHLGYNGYNAGSKDNISGCSNSHTNGDSSGFKTQKKNNDFSGFDYVGKDAGGTYISQATNDFYGFSNKYLNISSMKAKDIAVLHNPWFIISGYVNVAHRGVQGGFGYKGACVNSCPAGSWASLTIDSYTCKVKYSIPWVPYPNFGYCTYNHKLNGWISNYNEDPNIASMKYVGPLTRWYFSSDSCDELDAKYNIKETTNYVGGPLTYVAANSDKYWGAPDQESVTCSGTANEYCATILNGSIKKYFKPTICNNNKKQMKWPLQFLKVKILMTDRRSASYLPGNNANCNFSVSSGTYNQGIAIDGDEIAKDDWKTITKLFERGDSVNIDITGDMNLVYAWSGKSGAVSFNAYAGMGAKKKKCSAGAFYSVKPVSFVSCFGGYKDGCTNSRISNIADCQETEKVITSTLSTGSTTSGTGTSGSTASGSTNTIDILIGSCLKAVEGSSPMNQAYKDISNKRVNAFVDSPGLFTTAENVRIDHCGVCIKKSAKISPINGIRVIEKDTDFSPSAVGDKITNSTECQASNNYIWVKEYNDSRIDKKISYRFRQNKVISFCPDSSSEKLQNGKIVSLTEMSSPQRYSSDNIIYGSVSNNLGGSNSSIFKIPEDFGTGIVAFGYAGNGNNIKTMFTSQDQKDNTDASMPTGYKSVVITISQGKQIKEGEKLYIYIQEFTKDAEGEYTDVLDPKKHPSVVFAKMHHDTIITKFLNDPTIPFYNFYALDLVDGKKNGSARWTSDHSGKLWVGIMDTTPDINDPTPDSDGRMIVFDSPDPKGDTKVEKDSANVLYTNSGIYKVVAKAQKPLNGNDSVTKNWISNTINNVLIEFVKTIFFGSKTTPTKCKTYITFNPTGDRATGSGGGTVDLDASNVSIGQKPNPGGGSAEDIIAGSDSALTQESVEDCKDGVILESIKIVSPTNPNGERANSITQELISIDNIGTCRYNLIKKPGTRDVYTVPDNPIGSKYAILHPTGDLSKDTPQNIMSAFVTSAYPETRQTATTEYAMSSYTNRFRYYISYIVPNATTGNRGENRIMVPQYAVLSENFMNSNKDIHVGIKMPEMKPGSEGYSGGKWNSYTTTSTADPPNLYFAGGNVRLITDNTSIGYYISFCYNPQTEKCDDYGASDRGTFMLKHADAYLPETGTITLREPYASLSPQSFLKGGPGKSEYWCMMPFLTADSVEARRGWNTIVDKKRASSTDVLVTKSNGTIINTESLVRVKKYGNCKIKCPDGTIYTTSSTACTIEETKKDCVVYKLNIIPFNNFVEALTSYTLSHIWLPEGKYIREQDADGNFVWSSVIHTADEADWTHELFEYPHDFIIDNDFVEGTSGQYGKKKYDNCEIHPSGTMKICDITRYDFPTTAVDSACPNRNNCDVDVSDAQTLVSSRQLVPLSVNNNDSPVASGNSNTTLPNSSILEQCTKTEYSGYKDYGDLYYCNCSYHSYYLNNACDVCIKDSSGAFRSTGEVIMIEQNSHSKVTGKKIHGSDTSWQCIVEKPCIANKDIPGADYLPVPIKEQPSKIIDGTKLPNQNNTSSTTSTVEICEYDRNWKDGFIYQVFFSFTSSLELNLLLIASVILLLTVKGYKILTGAEKIDLETIVKTGFTFILTFGLFNGNAWELYRHYIVEGVFNLSEGFNTIVSQSIDPTDVNLRNMFGPVDKVFNVILLNYVTWLKLSAILFGGLQGFIYVIIMLFSFANYIITIARSVIMYVSSLSMMSIYLACGPLFIAFKVHPRTSSYFDNWWKGIMGFMVAQFYMFSIISLFTMLYLNIVESIFYFKICYRSIITIPLINVSILGWWSIASMPPAALKPLLQDYVSTVGDGYPSVTKIIVLLLIIAVMEKFLESPLFGGKGGLDSLFSSVSGKLTQMRKQARGAAIEAMFTPVQKPLEAAEHIPYAGKAFQVAKPITSTAINTARSAASGKT